ncbi:membrane dipeptidase [Streptomyces sp. NPDC058685]|uniref:membrane dipeptidase n=1 Tax=Streptomyces sp. NPDC058685 TaxID=3346598 RepID=UPI00364608F7
MADLQDDPQTGSAAVGDVDHVRDSAPAVGSAPAESGEPGAPAEEGPGPLERARELLARYPVIDGSNGLAHALRDMAHYDLEEGESLLETDIPRLRDGGVGALFWSLLTPPGLAGDRAPAATLEHIDLIRSVVEAHPEALRPARSADELAHARNCGRIAGLLGPVSGPALADSLATLRAYHALGVRSAALAGTRWTQRGGLTPFGHEVVREMNRLGMLVDLSGCNPETMQRTLAVTRAPAVISQHPTRVPDDVLRQLRANGGVCMAVCTAASVRETADLLDHIRDAAGPRTTALTGAYDTGAAHAPGLEDVSCYPRLIAELLERGWPEADIEALTWSNMYRVLRDAEFVARATQARRPASTARLTALDA